MEIPLDEKTLHGDLMIPQGAKGLVIFVHGSGSSSRSPRNQFVAKVLNKAGLATLLFDLLTAEEEEIDNRTSELRFDIELLSKRLEKVTQYIMSYEKTKDLRIGYFGASTGAAAALIAAARNPTPIHALVSRGGRPDLAGHFLQGVRAPTLLIVGGEDYGVIELNEEALAALTCEKKLEIIPGATHLFEEEGKLEKVAHIATHFFTQQLG